MQVQQAIRQFYQNHDFGPDGGFKPKLVWLKLGPIPVFPILNLPDRKKALRLHDIHHVVMGFNANWKGETAVSAWEIASGGWGRLWYVWFIVLSGMAGGILLFPVNTYKAFQKGLTMRNAFVCGINESEMLQMDIADLRKKWETTVSTERSFWKWALLSLMVAGMPYFILGGLTWLFFVA